MQKTTAREVLLSASLIAALHQTHSLGLSKFMGGRVTTFSLEDEGASVKGTSFSTIDTKRPWLCPALKWCISTSDPQRLLIWADESATTERQVILTADRFL